MPTFTFAHCMNFVVELGQRCQCNIDESTRAWIPQVHFRGRTSGWTVELPGLGFTWCIAIKLETWEQERIGYYSDGNAAPRLISHIIYRPTQWLARASDLSNRRSTAHARGDGATASQCLHFVRSLFADEAVIEPSAASVRVQVGRAEGSVYNGFESIRTA